MLAAFAAANGLDGLAATTVRIDAAGSDDERLVVDALVADTRTSRSRGLQGVADVPGGVGMLFVFPDPAGAAGRPGFWMLDTLVPLDIVFADGAGAIVGTATMQPCTARPCPTTHPGVPYDVALEVAAGTLDAAGVQVGGPARARRRPGGRVGPAATVGVLQVHRGGGAGCSGRSSSQGSSCCCRSPSSSTSTPGGSGSTPPAVRCGAAGTSRRPRWPLAVGPRAAAEPPVVRRA